MFGRYWRVFLIMGISCSLMGLIFGLIPTYMVPDEFESQALIEVMPPTSRMVAGIQMTPLPESDFSRTQAELIGSRPIIEKVVEQLELTKKWKMDLGRTCETVRSYLSVRSVRGTFLISIEVRYSAKKETQEIAEAVVECYKAYYTRQLRAVREESIDELKKATREKEDEVFEREKVYEALSKALEKRISTIPDTGERAESFPSVQDLEDEKRGLELAKRVLDGVYMMLVFEQADLTTADHSVVIHQSPSIPSLPASRGLSFNLVGGGICGLLLSPLLSFATILVISRSSRAAGFESRVEQA